MADETAVKEPEVKHGKSGRRRWWLYGVVTLGVLCILAGIGYAVVVSKIRSGLESFVSKSFDGELSIRRVYYRPPFGAVLVDVRIVKRDPAGGEREVFRASRVDVRLRKRPDGNGPVLIKSLEVSDPVVALVREPPPVRAEVVELSPVPQPAGATQPVVVEACPPPAPAEPMPKISDKVQISRLRVDRGTLRYEDRGRPDAPPMVAGGIQLELGSGGEGGAQPFTVLLDSGGAKVAAKGDFQPDDLVLAVSEASAEVKSDSGAIGRDGTSPLPPAVMEAVRKAKLAGDFKVQGRARVSLRDPANSTFAVTAEVTGGAAGVPDTRTAFHDAHIKLVCDNSPLVAASPNSPTTGPSSPPAPSPAGGGGAVPDAPPVHVKLLACRAGCGQDTIVLNEGAEFSRDPVHDGWKLAGLAGSIQTPRTGAPSAPQPVVGGLEHKGGPPPEGRFDFSGTAGGPVNLPPGKNWNELAHYELIAFPRDAVFRPNHWPLPIDHIGGGGSIRVADGVVTFRDLTGTYGGDKLNLLTARIPIPRNVSDLWLFETRVEEIAGTLTCYQPGPEYPPGLKSTIDQLRPEGTFDLSGRFTLRHDKPTVWRPSRRTITTSSSAPTARPRSA